MADDLFFEANDFMMHDEYSIALEKFNAAIEKDDKKARYFTSRSLCHLKLCNYADAKADGLQAVALDPFDSHAQFWLGQACFELDEFDSALNHFEQAQMHKQLFSKCDLYIRKCRAELELQKKSSPSARTASPASQKATEAKTTSSASSTPSAAAPAPAPAPVAATATSQPKPRLASKVRPDFIQSLSHVTLTLYGAKNLEEKDVDISSTEQSVSIKLSMPDGSTYEKVIDLFAQHEVKEARINMNKYKVEYIMKKKDKETWKSYYKQEADSITKRENQHSQTTKVKPYAGKSPEEWDQAEAQALKDEEDEKPEGDAALHKLFQQIFSSGTPEQQRAMMKSYQTSGGTVLSTNWDEVEKTDYTKDRKAPDGQEFRNWNDM